MVIADSLSMLAAGLAMAVDILVSGQGFKLSILVRLAGRVYFTGLEPASSPYKALLVSLWPAVLYESVFRPNVATMMTGPLIKTLKGGLRPP